MAFEELYIMSTLRTESESRPSTMTLDAEKDPAFRIDMERSRNEISTVSTLTSTPARAPNLEFVMQDDITHDTNFLPLLQPNDHQLPAEVSSSSSGTMVPDASKKSVYGKTESQAEASPNITDMNQAQVPDAACVDAVLGLPPRIISMAELTKHNTPDDMWLVIDGEVYNVTQFQHVHPGGVKGRFPFMLAQLLDSDLTLMLLVLSALAGKDATKKFDKYHRRAILDTYKASFQIGRLDERAISVPKFKTSLLRRIGIGRREKRKDTMSDGM